MNLEYLNIERPAHYPQYPLLNRKRALQALKMNFGLTAFIRIKRYTEATYGRYDVIRRGLTASQVVCKQTLLSEIFEGVPLDGGPPF